MRIIALLTGLLLFRIAYGLSLPFWFEDERQVYLIGLNAFAHGEWPYFGADVVWTGGRVPGALLGWLIRGALEIWPAPEAPVVLVNLISMAALALFAWYLARRLPGLPKWLVWTAPFLLPWTLNFSTHVVNPSYVLAGSIIFFVGFFEAMPGLRRGLLSIPVAWGLMAAGLGWTMQLHLSWVLLPPYAMAAFLVTLIAPHHVAAAGSRAHTLGRVVAGGAVGFAVTASLLLPSVMRYGVRAGQVDQAVQFQPQSPLGVVTTAARVLSFASFETNRFLGQSGAERALLLLRRPWLVPLVAILSIAGIVHPLWMTICAFRRSRAAPPDWMAVRLLTGGTILLIYGSYFLSVRGPQAHAFYVVWPVAMLFAGTCWEARAAEAGGRLRRMERMAAVVIAASVILHAGLGADRWSRLSLFVDRPLVAAAIDQREPRWLGERRTGARQDNQGITVEAEAFASAEATDDLKVVEYLWMLALDRFSSFDVTVEHGGGAAAWLDLRFVIGYRDQAGRHLATSEIVVKQILHPGDRRTWTQVPDRNAPPGAASASLALVGAEKVQPWIRPQE